MAKKIFYYITGSLMILALGLNIAAIYLNPQVSGGDITLWTLISVFAARPLFYTCLGAVSAVKLFSPVKNQGLRYGLLALGIGLLVLFAGISILELCGHPVTEGFFLLLRQVFRAPGNFLIPGLILGFGLFHP